MSRAIRNRAQSFINDVQKNDPPSAAAETTPAASQEEGGAELSRCLVYCRLRPTNSRDFEDGGFQLVTTSGKRVQLKDEKNYDFDGTFGQDCQQEDIFNDVAIPCLNHAFGGFCSALMCYGQTGTGKSFTMCCTKPGIEGIIPRSAKFIFDKINSTANSKFTVSCQFVQIYRDQLGDLMGETGREKVDIRWQADEGVTLPGCSEREIESAEDFMTFYAEGDSRRVVTATAMNPESSRGHTALVVRISSTVSSASGDRTTNGKITFIDLAGYERFSKTGISNSNAIMKDEAKTINASLLSLGHVVTALSNGDKHIPWRNAKLTRILQDSIGGRSRTSIILTVGPSSDHLHETTNSLQFGMRAMAVKVEAKVSVSVDYETLALRLQGMLDEKDKRINMLEVQIASNEAEREEMEERHRRDADTLRVRHENELEELRSAGATAEKILKVTELYEVEADNLKEQQMEEVTYYDEINNKEIVALANEQTRQESLRRTEMSMAQEKLIEEFEAKLADAREGTNSDLIQAIQQLSEKDVTLAARAAEIARLRSQLDDMLDVMKENNLQPVLNVDLVETFVDISQVEEMQRRLQNEIDRKSQQVVEYRERLDAMSAIGNERAQEVEQLKERNEALERELEKLGVTIAESEEKLSLAKVRTVDVAEFETMKITMKSDIDVLEKRVEELQTEVQTKTAQLKDAQKAAPRVRAGSTSLNRTANHQQDDGSREAKLAEENARLKSRLKAAMEKNGAVLEDDDTAEDLDQDWKLLVELRDDEYNAALKLAQKREDDYHSLEKKLRLMNGTPSAEENRDPIAALPFDEFIDLLRKARSSSRRLVFSSLEAKTPSGDLVGEALEEKDEELALKDEQLLSRGAHIAYLQKQLATLHEQLQDSQMEPCIHVDPTMLLQVKEDSTAHLDELKHQHEQLQAELSQKESEHTKLRDVLSSMADTRAKDAQVFASYKDTLELRLKEEQDRIRRLEEKELRTQAAMGTIVEEREAEEEKKRELETQVKELTRELMDQQARVGSEQQGLSLMDRLRKKMRN